MTIKMNKTDASLTLAIAGRLDGTTAPDLDAVVQTELAGITDLTFDFTDLEYVSSAGLRVLLAAQKIMTRQGKMKIVGANEIVMEVFEITGFTDILTIA